MVRIITFLITLFSFYSYIYPINYDHIRFKQIKPKQDELNNGCLNYIYQDKRGFIWFATPKGLFRYDSYKINSFFPLSNDTNSISGSEIFCITEDNDSNLWIATDNGLNKYIYRYNKFIQYKESRWPFVKNDYVSYLQIVGDTLWIATAYGLTNLNTKTFEYKVFDSNDLPYNTSTSFICSIVADNEHNVYILSSNGCFFKYDNLKKYFFLINIFPHELPFSKQEFMFNFNDSLIYIAYDQFLYEYNIKRPNIKELFIDKKPFRSPITGISSDYYGNVWMVSTYKEILIFDPKKKELLKHLFLNKHDGSSIDPSGFKCIFKSRDNILWLGSYENGVSYYHPKLFKFKIISSDQNNPYSLASNLVNAIYETSKKEVLIGTEDGLQVLNLVNNSFRRVVEIGKQPVLCIFEDASHNVWITTYLGKIYKRKFNSEIFEYQKFLSLSIPRAVKTIADDNNNLWFGTLGYGVYKYDGNKVISLQDILGKNVINPYINKIFF